MSWPLEPVSVHQFAEGLDEILVVEEKRSVIEDQLTGQLYNWPVGKRPRVVGEFDEQGNSCLLYTSTWWPDHVLPEQVNWIAYAGAVVVVLGLSLIHI